MADRVLFTTRYPIREVDTVESMVQYFVSTFYQVHTHRPLSGILAATRAASPA